MACALTWPLFSLPGPQLQDHYLVSSVCWPDMPSLRSLALPSAQGPAFLPLLACPHSCVQPLALILLSVILLHPEKWSYSFSIRPNVICPQVHSEHTVQGLARRKPGPGASFESLIGVQVPSTWTIFCCFSRHISRNWIRNEATGSQAGFHMDSGIAGDGLTHCATTLATIFSIITLPDLSILTFHNQIKN